MKQIRHGEVHHDNQTAAGLHMHAAFERRGGCQRKQPVYPAGAYLSPAGFTYGGEEVGVGGEGLQAAQQQHTPTPHSHPRERRTSVKSTLTQTSGEEGCAPAGGRVSAGVPMSDEGMASFEDVTLTLRTFG